MQPLDQLVKLLIQKQLTIATAESCTGGNLSAALTSQSGASAYFDRGFITYSNQSKIDMLGVKPATLDEFGAVSEQVALQMAQGVMHNSAADIGVSITGIAGPTGASQNKPVGMVCFGFYLLGECSALTQYFDGSREQVVNSSVNFAINGLVKRL
ncbi:CinA family protein [Candidatus Thioglobus sp.]|uniref:CinA family protein n=1 Tax=Candidatus Thioglobus sp. TaxID=2026721 RepID=UPI003D0A7671